MILQSSHAWCGYGFGSHITQKTGIILSSIGILGAFGGDILVDVLATTDPAYMKQIFYFTQNEYGFFQLLLGIGYYYFLESQDHLSSVDQYDCLYDLRDLLTAQ